MSTFPPTLGTALLPHLLAASIPLFSLLTINHSWSYFILGCIWSAAPLKQFLHLLPSRRPYYASKVRILKICTTQTSAHHAATAGLHFSATELEALSLSDEGYIGFWRWMQYFPSTLTRPALGECVNVERLEIDVLWVFWDLGRVMAFVDACRGLRSLRVEGRGARLGLQYEFLRCLEVKRGLVEVDFGFVVHLGAERDVMALPEWEVEEKFRSLERARMRVRGEDVLFVYRVARVVENLRLLVCTPEPRGGLVVMQAIEFLPVLATGNLRTDEVLGRITTLRELVVIGNESTLILVDDRAFLALVRLGKELRLLTLKSDGVGMTQT
ncbi:hypothetical protein K470DRAFT_271639 [Piedraia hortae CBS 480.64]|uniref:Uncharacterized protein n=1 Tax=Piedraia hortae CBS 480.64 TaxID=1314780 RepID=A0A6A7BXT8_9PEZI|nr:hypothetical protein K470DRAFT_271639 [Piedraia hortae CBS 480.64]